MIKELGKKEKLFPNSPPEFDIDVHVDDSLGVEMEGKKFGFKTIVVSVDDINWVNNILKKIDELIEIVKV